MQPPQQSQCEIQSKEKLATFVYEYLLLSGAQKSAETFKEEIVNNIPSSVHFKSADSGPGFLQSWWLVFWDLYCAAPERRDGTSAEPSQEGKMFYDIFVQGGGYGPGHMMNGMPGMFPPPGGGQMGMGGPEGMMPGMRGFPQGRPGPQGPMSGGYGMFPGGPDPRGMPPQRMPPNSMRMPNTSFAPGPGMRPTPGPPPQAAGGFRGPPFMDSPNQGFPPSAMMPNGMGSQAPMSMASPGMPPGPPGVPDGYGMMGIPPSSSSMPPYCMGDASVSVGNNGMPPSHGDGPPMMMMGSEEIKQSPASTPHGINGGTPAPGSAQSGPPPSSGTPVGPPLEDKPGSNSKPEDMDEISKIKQGLMDDSLNFTETATAEQASAGGGSFYN
ncbi:unnamed protein product [Auanema sp. JU1783]|nr:unnamed protein product [Auanema sp. JU1783]